MRLFIAFAATVALVLTLGPLGSQAQEKKAQEKLIFESKMGNVTFLHVKHTEREKADCKVCHDKLFPQDAKAPLNFKLGMHKPAEAKKTGCTACHIAGGKAFAVTVTANCGKCHVKAAAKG
ncbi:MAG: cytochrome c3 family protein [Acidobacteriota bacterium]